MEHTAPQAKITGWRIWGYTILGALLMGLLWRLRGEGGWGSSWGLLNAGVVFTLFLVLVRGERQKMNIGWLGLTAASFMLTTPGWGTLLNQITGLLQSTSSVSNEVIAYEISPLSGVFLMFAMGFGLAAIYGFMLGRWTSGRAYRLRDFVIILAVFFAVNLLAKASLAHFILDLVQPQAKQAFADGLAGAGITDSVWMTYLKHFDNVGWMKPFHGGRNYHASIDAIASMLSALAVWITVRFGLRDKRCASAMLTVCMAFGAAITAADLLFFFGSGGYRMQGGNPFPDFVPVWSMWEYMTGFLAGGTITYALLRQRPEPDLREHTFDFIPQRLRGVLVFLLSFVFACSVSLVRPVMVRLEDSAWQIPATAVLSVLLLVLCLLICKRYGPLLERTTLQRFAAFALPVFLLFDLAVYFFVGTGEDMFLAHLCSLAGVCVVVSASAVLGYCGAGPLRIAAKERRIRKPNPPVRP